MYQLLDSYENLNFGTWIEGEI